MQQLIKGICFHMLLLTIFLFDPSELCVGCELVNMSPLSARIMIMLGSGVWVLGVCFAISAAAFFCCDNSDLVSDIEERLLDVKTPMTTWHSPTLYTIYIVVGVVGLGSGFWFT